MGRSQGDLPGRGVVCELGSEDGRVLDYWRWREKALRAMETTWKEAEAVLEMQ